MFKNNKKKPISSNHAERLMTQDYSIPVNLIKKTELLLPYKSYIKRENKERLLKYIDIRVYDRYKLLNTELMKELKEDARLYRVNSVSDNNEDFLKIVNRRSLVQCIPVYKSLKNIWNSRFRILQEIGYKKDNILNIDVTFRTEKKFYELSLRRFSEQAKIFDKFIMEDYQNSMRLLNEGEKLNIKLDAKMAELQNLADASCTIISRLLGLDYKYSLQQKYGRFLYYLSPPVWRSNNREFARSVEIEAKGFDYGNTNIEDSFTTLFEKMRMDCLRSPVKPVLYFTHPKDLIDVFNGMEEQQLYHLIRETQLIPHTKSIKNGIRLLKEEIEIDSAVVKASIKGFKTLLSDCEERSALLEEQFFKILYGHFYESVGTADVLKLVLHLEFCYEKVFNEKPINLDIVTMAKSIETTFLDYSRRLDSIQSDTVRAAMEKIMDLNNRKINKAKKAGKELRLFNRLEHELLRAHNLVSRQVNTQSTIVPKRVSKGICSKTNGNKMSIQSLTDAQIEYLTLFTDWTGKEDPALYLQSIEEK